VHVVAVSQQFFSVLKTQIEAGEARNKQLDDEFRNFKTKFNKTSVCIFLLAGGLFIS
jgi:hypothetical protein